MVTTVKLGFGVIKLAWDGVRLFLDDEHKTPDFRLDEGERFGPNKDEHVHFGDGEGQSIGKEAADFLLGAASTNYHSKREDSLRERDYIFSDEYTLRYSRRD
jgi:hypothetical protein